METKFEKGNMVVNETKKGFEIKVKLESMKGGVQFRCADKDKELFEGYKGKGEIEVEGVSVSGQIIKLKIGENIYEPYSRIKVNTQPKIGGGAYIPKNTATPSNSATAPYNFVPLNDKVVIGEEIPKFNQYHKDRHTGYFDIDIETKTPIYIRDTRDQNDLENESKIEDFIVPDFYSPAGQLRIPGSSLRGLIRTMVEITSFSKMSFIDKDAQYYYRAVGDKSSLGIKYRRTMVDDRDNQFPKINAGFLYKEGRDYFIRPSKVKEGTQFYRVEKHDVGFAYREFTNYKVYFDPVAPKIVARHRIPLKYALVKNVVEDRGVPVRGKSLGYLIRSGDFSNKKHMHWIINEGDEEKGRLKIDQKLIEAYKNDSNRDDRVNLLKQSNKEETPCFYLVDPKDNMRVTSFGHTGMFRLQYEKPVEHMLLDAHRKEGITDIATAIFGRNDTFAGRVQFEDSLLKSELNTAYLNKEVAPRILGGPKPTSFQLYLEQESNNERNLKTYNDNATIRGNKLYWHADNGDGYIQRDSREVEKHKKQYTRIKPVSAGAKFSGRIRFENLSDVELGALITAIELKEGLYHKIGMAKSLGLGSIKISSKLYISDREKRYKELTFELNGVDTPKEQHEQKKYVDKFNEYVLKNIDAKTNNIWEIDRLKELESMLSWARKPDRNQVKYMELTEFKNRKVLPKPSKIARPPKK